MTEEYKRQILDYITNYVNKTFPNDSEIFLEQEEISFDKWQEVIPENSIDFKFEGMIAGNELTTNLTVLYGGYRFSRQEIYGIIVLVDENFEPVKAIYEYSSGTKLRYIQEMRQAEDGTFYFIDDEAFSYKDLEQVMTSQKRFVMTNNFTIKNQLTNDYQVNLRTSYILSGNYVNFYCKNMYKDPNSAHYIFFGVSANQGAGGEYAYYTLKIIGLKVNVGSANEWTMYENSLGKIYGSSIAMFEEDNVKFRCLYCNNSVSTREVSCVSKTYTGSVVSTNITTFDYQPYVDTNGYDNQSVFLSYDDVYFVQNNQRWGISGSPNDKYIGLYKYNFINNITTTIFEKYLGSYAHSNKEAIYIEACNNDLYIQYNTNIASRKADYYFQRLVNDTWNPILIGESKNFMLRDRSIYVKSNFNLLQVYLYTTAPQDPAWFQYLIKEDYNPLNYNGTPYIDYDSLISEKGQIYSNNKIVFARDLYNKNINNNSTVSTIQVPNNYLNDISLDLKKLISKTNLDICNEENITTKNIYEMLFINYINTINVIDEDTGTLYPGVANYVNYNINVGTEANCKSSFIGKAKINCNDNTCRTQILTWHWNTDHYEVAFTIDTTTTIPTSIDFVSNDETMVYMTKQLDLEQNKYYVIKQKLRIE